MRLGNLPEQRGKGAGMIRKGPYFIIDSENSAEAGSELFGFCCTESGVATDFGVAPRDMRDQVGAWVRIERTDDRLEVTQDAVGCFGLYLYRDGGYWALSNSFNDLAAYLAPRHRLTLNKDYADAFLGQGICVSVYAETMFREIAWLDRRATVSIDLSSGELGVRMRALKEKTVPVDSEEGLRLLDAWHDTWVRFIRGAAKSWPGRICVDVSGGFDTRMVLAVVLSSGIDVARIWFNSTRKRPEDYRIASMIAERYGFALNMMGRPLVKERRVPLRRYLDIALSALCFEKIVYSSVGKRQRVPTLRLGGHGGGMVRGYGHRTSRRGYIRTAAKQARGVFAGLARPGAPAPSTGIEAILNRSFDAIGGVHADIEGLEQREATGQQYYMETRHRSHFGLPAARGFASHRYDAMLLADPIIHKIDESWAGRGALMPALIFTRYCPGLAEFPLEGGRSIGADALSYARELNERFPYQGLAEEAPGFVTQPTQPTRLEGSGEADGWIAEDGPEAGMLLHDAFMAPEVKHLIGQLYGPTLYGWIAAHPRSEGHADLQVCGAVAVAWAMHVAQCSQRAAACPSIADFVRDCAQQTASRDRGEAPVVSVVLDLRDREAQAQELLEDFAAQSLQNFEAICVLDGAADWLAGIVAAFCEKDTRFSQIELESGGTGGARNAGMDLARGEYILWPDSGARYSQDYLRHLFETARAQEADVVVGRLWEAEKDGRERRPGFGEAEGVLESGRSYAPADVLPLYSAVDPRVADCMYRLAPLREAGIRHSDARSSEDLFFCVAALANAERVALCPNAGVTATGVPGAASGAGECPRHLEDTAGDLHRLFLWLSERGYLERDREGLLALLNGQLSMAMSHGAIVRFVREWARILSEEEPFASMSSEELLEAFGPSLLERQAEAGAAAPVHAGVLGSDDAVGERLQEERNRAHAAEILRRICMEKYGRRFPAL